MHIEVKVTELGSKECGASAHITFTGAGGLEHVETISGRVSGAYPHHGYCRVFEVPDGVTISKIHSTGPITVELQELR